MKNLIFLLLFALFVFIGCTKDNYESTRPGWMQEMIDSIENDEYYAGSKIYRYVWKSEYYYHLDVPLSSFCCFVFTEKGNSVDWTEEDMTDYFENRKKKKVVWRQ